MPAVNPEQISNSVNTSADSSGIQQPPGTLRSILRRLGPGLIIAGSIVGSGELIATTKTGAQAGITLLWLIVVGCMIKVFVQIELGRYTISSGDTCLAGLNQVPGPRWRVNWIIWYWVVMMLVGLGQVGGILGGVGQSLALAFPITGDFQSAVAADLDVYTWDDKYWAITVTLVTVAVLVRGRYGLIQSVAIALVASFTLLTIGNVIALQFTQQWSVSADEVLSGLMFRLPEQDQAVMTALAAFGIIGVGADELIVYPYWCLEKGYARFTGRHREDAAWADRARGWMKVLTWDACLSMLIYTTATIAFYILGACVLNRLPEGSGDPQGMRMVYTLALAYEPVFDVFAKYLFLVGAFAVLYSTFFVGTAGTARVIADAFRVFGVIKSDDRRRYDLAVSLLCLLLPVTALGIFLSGSDPVTLVLTSGMMQSLMLPMLGVAALYFRYRHSDPRLQPGRLWTALLWISCLGLLLAGAATLGSQISEVLSFGV